MSFFQTIKNKQCVKSIIFLCIVSMSFTLYNQVINTYLSLFLQGLFS